MSNQPVTLEQLLGYVERAVRGDRRLLVQLFRKLQQLSRLPSAPEEERRLGSVLSAILMGDRDPDMRELPEEMAAEIREMLERLKQDKGD